jgi:hypothetical protein
VDAHQLAESQAVIFRYGLNSPLIFAVGFAAVPWGGAWLDRNHWYAKLARVG